MYQEHIHAVPDAKIRNFTDDELHQSAVRTAGREREINLLLLKHLNEIERRHLFSKFCVSSLHGYCVKELKMDDGMAGRRISAARLLRELPSLEDKVADGALAITSLAQAGIFFRKEAKVGHAFALEEKRDLVSQLESKPTREVERILLSAASESELHLKEKISMKTATQTEVRVYLDDDTMADLQFLKDIWSHANPDGSLAEVIKRVCRSEVCRQQRAKPERKTADGTSAPKSASVPKAKIKRIVRERDQNQCTFTHPVSGERCSAKSFLEEDHVIPKAMGGDYSVENIRLRCRAHNLRHAIDRFGVDKMRQHVHSMKH